PRKSAGTKGGTIPRIRASPLGCTIGESGKGEKGSGISDCGFWIWDRRDVKPASLERRSRAPASACSSRRFAATTIKSRRHRFTQNGRGMAQPSSRMRTFFQWIRLHRKTSAAFAVLLAFALLNVWAFRHAWAMTHFSSGGKSTIRPEELSVLGRAVVLLTGVNLPRPANDRTPADLNLPFESHRLRTADGVELEAWYIAHPDARATVVLFHGYGTSKSKLLNEAGVFYELRCNTLLVDFRGRGGWEGNTTTLGVYEALDVAGACDLAQKLDPHGPP